MFKRILVTLALVLLGIWATLSLVSLSLRVLSAPLPTILAAFPILLVLVGWWGTHSVLRFVWKGWPNA